MDSLYRQTYPESEGEATLWYELPPHGTSIRVKLDDTIEGYVTLIMELGWNRETFFVQQTYETLEPPSW